MTKGGNKNACVYKKNMDPPSPPSATGLCPEGTAIETKQDCKAAYDWFKAMDTGCPITQSEDLQGNCGLAPNPGSLAPASYKHQT